MKLSIWSVFLFLNMNVYSQISKFEDIPISILESLDKMGIDDSSILNNYESEYFNTIFKNPRKSFDFTGKKIGFITGITGNILSSKKEYFNLEKYRLNHNYSPNTGVLYVFTESQKEESGGYDAVIVYWSKALLRSKDLPKKMKGKHSDK